MVNATRQGLGQGSDLQKIIDSEILSLSPDKAKEQLIIQKIEEKRAEDEEEYNSQMHEYNKSLMVNMLGAMLSGIGSATALVSHEPLVDLIGLSVMSTGVGMIYIVGGSLFTEAKEYSNKLIQELLDLKYGKKE